MPTTLKKLLRYPDSNGHTRLWEHLQNLAQDVDAELDKANPNVPPAWTTQALVWRNVDGQPLSVGNGASSLRYMKVGRTVHMAWWLTRGSTTNVGTGNYHFDLPFAAADYRGYVGSGVVMATATEPLAVHQISSSTFVMLRPNGARLANNSFAWASGHSWQGSLTYEAAA